MALARNTDPYTAHAAARQVNEERLFEDVLNCLRTHPEGLTTVEIAAITNNAQWSISPRMRPLEQRGLIMRVGKKKNPSNRQAIIWRTV